MEDVYRCTLRILILLVALGSAPATVVPAWGGEAPGAASAAAARQAGGAAPVLQHGLEGLAGTLRPDQIDPMLAVLDDQQVRTAFRGMLARQIEAEAAGPAARPEPNLLEIYQERLDALVPAAAALPADLAAALGDHVAGGRAINPARLFTILAGLILLGILAQQGTRRLLSESRHRLEQGTRIPSRRGVVRFLLRLLYDVIEIAAFVLAIVCVYLVLSPTDPRAPRILHELLRVTVGVLAIVKISRLILAPADSALRLVPFGDAAARQLHRIIVGVVTLLAALGGLVGLLGILGLRPESLTVTRLSLGIVASGVLLALIWTHRRPVEQAIRHLAGTAPGAGQMAVYWPLAASAYVTLIWLLSVDAVLRNRPSVIEEAVASLLIVLAVPAAALSAERALRRFFGLPERPRDRPLEPAALTLAAPAAPVTGVAGAVAAAAAAVPGGASPAPPPAGEAEAGVARLMWPVWMSLFVAAAMLTARLWGIDPQSQAGIGAAAARVLLHSSLVVLVSYIGYELLSLAIDRRLEQAARGDTDVKARRLATLLPLLRKFVLVVVVVMVGLTLLSSVGVEIAPLLAGAGVIGIAIGLGAQSLVTDVLSGIFFLIDDAFRIGDYIEVGPLRGTVESMSIRSIKLRHHRGAVHTIPFGQMKSLTNYSRDWVIMKLEIPVPADTDLDLVKKIVKRIGADLLAHPTLGPEFLEPVKSQGVRRIEDSALVLGVKFMAKPGEQFLIRKEVYERLRAAFQQSGIAFASRGVTVRVDGTAAVPPEVVSAAASAAIGQKG